MDIESLIKATQATILKGTTSIPINKISTDTRTIKKGDFYLPLKGEHFDGEKFIDNALEKGAVGYFTTTNYINNTANVILSVQDATETYLKIANYTRNKINPKVIAITGSSGKTTTKEMVASVCSTKFKTHKTALNHNNEIGFCQTLMDMPNDTEILVTEMGMRGLGQIELLSKYANPDISVITNVGTAHIGILGSRENIAKAKCEIVKHQNPNGVFIAPNDDLIKQTIQFDGEQIYVDDFKIIEHCEGHTKFEYKNKIWEINIEGECNVIDAIYAIEVGFALNMDYKDINTGLKLYSPIEKRWEISQKNGYKIINDSYNANPESVKSALKTVFQLYPQAVIILGNMGELGKDEKIYHKEVGEFIKTQKANYKKLITIGNLAKEISDINNNSINFETNTQAANYILKEIEKNSTLFLKASRTMKFEEISKMIGSAK